MLSNEETRALINDYMRAYQDMTVRWSAKQVALGHEEGVVTTLILCAQTHIGNHGRDVLRKLAEASMLPDDEQDAAFQKIEDEAWHGDTTEEFQRKYDEALRRARLGEF